MDKLIGQVEEKLKKSLGKDIASLIGLEMRKDRAVIKELNEETYWLRVYIEAVNKDINERYENKEMVSYNKNVECEPHYLVSRVFDKFYGQIESYCYSNNYVEYKLKNDNVKIHIVFNRCEPNPRLYDLAIEHNEYGFFDVRSIYLEQVIHSLGNYIYYTIKSAPFVSTTVKARNIRHHSESNGKDFGIFNSFSHLRQFLLKALAKDYSKYIDSSKAHQNFTEI